MIKKINKTVKKKSNRKISKHYFSKNKKEYFYFVRLDRKQTIEFCKKKGLKAIKMSFQYLCVSKELMKNHEAHISVLMTVDRFLGIILYLVKPIDLKSNKNKK